MARGQGRGADTLTPNDFRGSAVGSERRREPRALVQKTISILPYDRDPNSRFQRVQMVDCSIHGIGILSPARLETGERFLAKLKIGRKMFLTAYTSRRCVQEGEKFHVGAEFTGFISGAKDDPDEILKNLMAEAKKP